MRIEASAKRLAIKSNAFGFCMGFDHLSKKWQPTGVMSQQEEFRGRGKVIEAVVDRAT